MGQAAHVRIYSICPGKKGPLAIQLRKDNSKGNIIALFNTNRVYCVIFISKNLMFIHINVIFICFGVPEPHLQRFRLAAFVFVVLVENDMGLKG